MVPAASAVVADPDGLILLQKRQDNDLWALPGGGMEIGETIGETAVREVKEETGYDVRLLYLIGVYSEPGHIFEYDDGEVRQEFSVCFACELVGGELAVSDESHEVAWFSPEQIRTLSMHERIRIRILDYTSGRRGIPA